MKTPIQKLLDRRGGDKVYPAPGTIDHTVTKPGACGLLPTKLPCVECPLARASIPGRLGGYAVDQYLYILHIMADIACHMSDGFEADDLATQRSCTGVAMYRANLGMRGMGHVRQAIEAVEQGDCSLAFDGPESFAAHHGSKGS